MAERVDVCAVVVSHLPHDSRVQKQVRSLAAAGLSVRAIGLRYGIERTEVHRTGPGERLELIEQPFGERGRGGALRRARIMLRLWWRVLRTPADTYVCHNVHPVPAVLAAARLRRARVIYDAHELYGEVKPGAGPVSRLAARASRAGERRVVRRAACVFTTNPSRARILSERHGGREVGVLANVPELSDPAPADPGFPEGRRILLYQGGIYAEARAFRATIAAIPLLPADVDLAILGFGPARDLELIDRWARELGVSARVHRYGPVPFDRMVATARAADAGLVPLRRISQNSWLGDTNKLFEYLMAGIPVAGSDFPEVARVLAEGDPAVGAGFDPEDPASIAAAVTEILEHDYQGRCAQARALAVERYNWALQAEALLTCWSAADRSAASSMAGGG